MQKASFKTIINTFEVYLGAGCSGIMIILLFLQVFSRYVLRHSFSWTEELALIFFILSIYFGATAAVRRKQHLRLEVILNKMSPKGKLVLEIINNLVFMAFNIIILTGLQSLIARLHGTGVRTAVTSIPKWIIYSFLPVLFILMIIRLIQDVVAKIQELKNGPAPDKGAGESPKPVTAE
jgi:TRAP-type C4-dicarboxylate transport system permease small subunit